MLAFVNSTHRSLLCILLVLLISIADGRRRKGSSSVTEPNHFDVLIFTQRWPQTVCFEWKEDAPSHKCSLPKYDEWTIHGIWPSQYHRMGPQYCNNSMPFNQTALKPLEDVLKDKWIDVQNGEKPYSFWKHEWDKHGTCAAVLERFDTEVKYFREALHLLDVYDMKDVLGKSNILPGFKYTVSDIRNAIEKILGKRAAVMCAPNKKTGELYIFEIRICFDKTMQLIHCDGILEYPTNCQHTEQIVYPGDVPHNYLVVQI